VGLPDAGALHESATPEPLADCVMLCGGDGAPYVPAACAGIETKSGARTAVTTEITANLPLTAIA
jgi:hypothetical protein